MHSLYHKMHIVIIGVCILVMSSCDPDSEYPQFPPVESGSDVALGDEPLDLEAVDLWLYSCSKRCQEVDLLQSLPPLIEEAAQGHTTQVQNLLNSGMDINMQTESGQTALMFAANLGHFDMVKLLLELRADVHIKDKNGHTALMLAALSNEVEIVQLLKSAGATEGLQEAALIKAVKQEELETIKSLIQAGADTNAMDNDGQSALMWAVYEGNADIVKILRHAGATEGLNEAKLLKAIGAEDLKYVQHILEEGADVNMRIPDIDDVLISADAGDSMLMYAVEKGNMELVQILLDNDADINARGSEGRTALMIAAQFDSVDILNLLLERGANVNARDANGESALMYGMYGAPVDLAPVLAAPVDSDGETASILGADNGYADVVKLLLEKGANVDARDCCQQTALMVAAGLGDVETVKILLEYGADITLKDSSGETALMQAGDSTEIVQLLEQYGEVKRPDTTQRLRSGNPIPTIGTPPIDATLTSAPISENYVVSTLTPISEIQLPSVRDIIKSFGVQLQEQKIEPPQQIQATRVAIGFFRTQPEARRWAQNYLVPKAIDYYVYPAHNMYSIQVGVYTQQVNVEQIIRELYNAFPGWQLPVRTETIAITKTAYQLSVQGISEDFAKKIQDALLRLEIQTEVTEVKR